MVEELKNEQTTHELVRSLVDRLERLEDEKKDEVDQYNDWIKDVFDEAEGRNIDKKALRELLRRRRAERKLTDAQKDDLHQYELFVVGVTDLASDVSASAEAVVDAVTSDDVESVEAIAADDDAPQPEGPFKDGMTAWHDGVVLGGNPFASGTPEHTAWENGWIQAEADAGAANSAAAE